MSILLMRITPLNFHLAKTQQHYKSQPSNNKGSNQISAKGSSMKHMLASKFKQTISYFIEAMTGL